MPTLCWIKHLCSIRAWVPMSFVISCWLLLWSVETRCAQPPTQPSKTVSRRCTVPSPLWEGAWDLREKRKPCVKDFIGFLRKPANISLSLSLFYFLIVNSRPPGYGPLKDLNKWRPEQGPGTRGRFGWSDSKGLLRSLSTKTWVKWLESPITFLLYFITSLQCRDFQFHASE